MEDKTYVVDRVEENIAICEDKSSKELVKIEVEKLPKGVKEGSIIVEKNNTFLLDKTQEARKSSIIKQKMDKLWKKQRKS